MVKDWAGKFKIMTKSRLVRAVSLAGVAGVATLIAAWGHASTGAASAWRTWGKPATVNLPPAVDNRFARIDYNNFEDRVRGVMADPSMVGLGIAVVENGRIVYAKGFGTTQAVGGEPVSARTVFRWASLSKGVAATMVGELVADGKVSLDAPVSKYGTTLRLPAGGETRATVDDVLSHRLGIVRNALDNKLEAGIDPKVLRPQLAALPVFCAPGACHTYQNVAFDASSEIVQNMTGKSYQYEVQQRLFAPLGMIDASVSRAGLVAARSWAKPHVGRRTVTVNDNYYRVPAAGGVNSSILDLGRWMQAQMGEMPEVIPDRVLETIHTPRIFTDRHLGMFNKAMGASQYSLGWRDYNYLGHRLIGHQGAVMGYRATVLFDPQKKSGIAMLWNSQSSRPVALQLELLDRLYNLPHKDWAGLDKGRAIQQASATITPED